ncbi:MAG: S-methyl-5-thioribose-1-phosphate isomerase [SAR324 cluster bacterium]|nr:S-methyl-5-thioribose-1-phosphate isomerase [SAR324 cluster bacterium]MBF0352377.1 S-methyl-5-thioribose-1-phosphate isomerase [SAR324 cluster bacterium]
MLVQGTHYRTVWFEQNRIRFIQQNDLPHFFNILTLSTYEEAAHAIEHMLIRGAPAIGAMGGFGMALAILNAPNETWKEEVQTAAQRLRSTRPTAQNLFFGIERVLRAILQATNLQEAINRGITEAQNLADDEVNSSREIGRLGAELIQDGWNILTHCNAGWLACVDWGTALAPIYYAAQEGKKCFVYADETRPRGQGSKLTAWELGQAGIDHLVIADNAAGHFMSRGKIQMVITGADRIAANGDAANKIGTYTKAVLAQENNIPFYVAAPLSTVDFNCPSGAEIPIEERSQDEVHYTWGLNDDGNIVRVRTTPEFSQSANPAFDVTPARFITGIITEKGIVAPHQISQLKA